MATPRSLLVDPEQPLFYHLVSRCVRSAWLCGEHDGHSFEHRRAWIEERILYLAQAFAVDIMAYAVMSNHFHIIAYFDPLACLRWTDDEVVRRSLIAYPPANGDTQSAAQELLDDPALLRKRRYRLGSLSGFMQHLKQPISFRINREDGVKGHLFEQRFYSGALLDEKAVIAAMSYVDLNPFRAQIAQSIEEADFTSIQRRLQALASTPERLEKYLAPLAGRAVSPDGEDGEAASDSPLPQITLRAYIEHLRDLMACATASNPTPAQTSRAEQWTQSAQLLRKKQRAYGSQGALTEWLKRNNMRRLEKAFP